MPDIATFIHSFEIEGNEIKLAIECKNGCWKADVISGKTPVGTCSGGKYNSVEEYIKSIEHEHRYAFGFYKKQ